MICMYGQPRLDGAMRRSVFAYWRQETGAPKRARFFKLPCQMTNTQLAISITATPAISVR